MLSLYGGLGDQVFRAPTLVGLSASSTAILTSNIQLTDGSPCPSPLPRAPHRLVFRGEQIVGFIDDRHESDSQDGGQNERRQAAGDI